MWCIKYIYLLARAKGILLCLEFSSLGTVTRRTNVRRPYVEIVKKKESFHVSFLEIFSFSHTAARARYGRVVLLGMLIKKFYSQVHASARQLLLHRYF